MGALSTTSSQGTARFGVELGFALPLRLASMRSRSFRVYRLQTTTTRLALPGDADSCLRMCDHRGEAGDGASMCFAGVTESCRRMRDQRNGLGDATSVDIVMGSAAGGHLPVIVASL
jgi:hypothetical protein